MGLSDPPLRFGFNTHAQPKLTVESKCESFFFTIHHLQICKRALRIRNRFFSLPVVCDPGLGSINYSFLNSIQVRLSISPIFSMHAFLASFFISYFFFMIKTFFFRSEKTFRSSTIFTTGFTWRSSRNALSSTQRKAYAINLMVAK